MQSFAIPGSIFLSVLCGYLFRFPVALALVCFCSAAGASICYLLAQLVARPLVKRVLANKLNYASSKIADHREHMLHYMIFLRITPILPNWLINISAPILDVPMSPFFWGTFLGRFVSYFTLQYCNVLKHFEIQTMKYKKTLQSKEITGR